MTILTTPDPCARVHSFRVNRLYLCRSPFLEVQAIFHGRLVFNGDYSRTQRKVEGMKFLLIASIFAFSCAIPEVPERPEQQSNWPDTDTCCRMIYATFMVGRRKTAIESFDAARPDPRRQWAIYRCRDTRSNLRGREQIRNSDRNRPFVLLCPGSTLIMRMLKRSTYIRRPVASRWTAFCYYPLPAQPYQAAHITAGTTECLDTPVADQGQTVAEAWVNLASAAVESANYGPRDETFYTFLDIGSRRDRRIVLQSQNSISYANIEIGDQYRICASRPSGSANVVLKIALL